MFSGKSTASCALRQIWKTTGFRRSIGTSLSDIKKSRKNTKIKRQVKSEDINIVATAGSDKMPPKKLRLATKVKNLASSLRIADHKKFKLTESMKSEGTETNLPSQSSLLKTEQPTSAIMENAIAKSKLNLRNLRPKDSEKKTEESKTGKSSTKRAPKAVVDIEMMKSELKQLEDPPITEEDKLLSVNRLGFEFFDVPSETLAKNLLGKILVRKLENGTILKGRIVETESYLGGEDKASQTYQNKVTPRNIPMYMPPGTIYVYLTYGMYHCFNVSSRGKGSVVLIRAIDPIEGMEQMAEFRNAKPTANSKSRSLRNFKSYELSNGPSKFCMAFGLTRDHNKYSMCEWKGMWIEDSDEPKDDFKIVRCPRIGIDSAGPEWAMKPLRFYILGDQSVSKKDKKAEAAIGE